jgi:hypothetical protein
MDNAVSLVGVEHFLDMIQAVGIGRENGAVHLEIAVSDGVQHFIHRLTRVIGQVAGTAFAYARFLAYNDRTGGFHDRQFLSILIACAHFGTRTEMMPIPKMYFCPGVFGWAVANANIRDGPRTIR